MHAVEVSHLTKEYRLGAMQSLKQTAAHVGARLMGRTVAEPPLFKALDDVSFTVEPGEVIGIIGHNGAGKSTLLKMLSRISTPTSGSVKINGRVAPLIEVGAGFVGDFTGRENVYLNGAILGMSKREIDTKFDEIVDFAEMAEFIDTPVKRYSSGMQVKLAFAVATSIESEILIVDEVLAVGDLAFQRKCFDRMEELIKRQRRTVLLVSHNIRQVERMSNVVLMMDHGTIVHAGDPKTVCNAFFEYSDRKIHSQLTATPASNSTRSAQTGELELLNITFLDKHGKSIEQVKYLSEITIVLEMRANTPLHDIAIGVGAHTPDMIFVANDDSSLMHAAPINLTPGVHIIRYKIPRIILLPGVYSLRVGVAPNGTDRVVFYGENLHNFTVKSETVSYSRTVNQGFVSLEGTWSVVQVNQTQTESV
jgi:lipopolysaccharide transport system ATP-binding protein